MVYLGKEINPLFVDDIPECSSDNCPNWDAKKEGCLFSYACMTFPRGACYPAIRVMSRMFRTLGKGVLKEMDEYMQAAKDIDDTEAEER